MNAEQYLQQAYRLDNLIDSNRCELRKLRDLSTSIVLLDTSTERVQGGNAAQDKIGNVVTKIADLEREIKNDIDKLVDLLKEIRAVIDNIPNHNERLLLRYRYLNGFSWETIMEKMPYSERQIFRIHHSALKKVGEIMPVSSDFD